MQKNITKKFIQAAKLLILGLVLGLGVGLVSADWTPPSASAPACPTGQAGCDASIDVSGVAQSKSGMLNLTFDQNGSPALTVTNGVTIGNVLYHVFGTAPGVVGLNESSSAITNWNPTNATKAALMTLGNTYSLGNLSVLGNITADYRGDINPASNANFYMPLDLAPQLNSGAPLNIDLSQNSGSNTGNAINIVGNSQTGSVGITQNVPIFSFSNSSGQAIVDASKIELQDGTQGAGKVLVSNANGLSSWSALPATTPNNYEVIDTEVNNSGGSSSIDGGAYSPMDLESTSNIHTFYCPADHPIMLSAGGNCLSGGVIATSYVTNLGTSSSPGSMYLGCISGQHASGVTDDMQSAQYLCIQSNTIETPHSDWVPAAGTAASNESCVTWLGGADPNVTSDNDVGVFTDNTCQYEVPQGGNSCLYEESVQNTTGGPTNSYDIMMDGYAVNSTTQNTSNANTTVTDTPEVGLSKNDGASVTPPVDAAATTCYKQ